MGELSVELEQFIGAGDKVVVFVREKGHSKTDIQMDEHHADVYTVKSRKIVRRQASPSQRRFEIVGLREGDVARLGR